MYFQTGTDVHGEKVQRAALEAGETPAHYAERMSDQWQRTWDELNIRYDRFIRTTDGDHREAVANIASAIHDAGQIEFREYEGLYCVGCERFLTDRDLLDGRCRDHEQKPETRREANYFFKMSEHFEWLTRTLEENPELIQPARYRNEVLAMVREGSGLEDLCISRPKERLAWGIELPFDSNYVCYVWFDALVNYLSGCGWPARARLGRTLARVHTFNWQRHFKTARRLLADDAARGRAAALPRLARSRALANFRTQSFQKPRQLN